MDRPRPGDASRLRFRRGAVDHRARRRAGRRDAGDRLPVRRRAARHVRRVRARGRLAARNPRQRAALPPVGRACPRLAVSALPRPDALSREGHEHDRRARLRGQTAQGDRPRRPDPRPCAGGRAGVSRAPRLPGRHGARDGRGRLDVAPRARDRAGARAGNVLWKAAETAHRDGLARVREDLRGREARQDGDVARHGRRLLRGVPERTEDRQEGPRPVPDGLHEARPLLHLPPRRRRPRRRERAEASRGARLVRHALHARLELRDGAVARLPPLPRPARTRLRGRHEGDRGDGRLLAAG